MRKHNKTLSFIVIFIAIVSIFTFVRVEVFAQDNQPQVAQTTTGQEHSKTKADKPLTIPQKNAYALSHIPNKGFKFALFKFLAAMFGVFISALAIWIGLKIYKKIVLKDNSKLDEIDYNKTLESPKDFREAINLFLDKTDRN